ncbi:Crp/Fnr family transcriptional regulator [Umezawaea sp.]|uniref:Crp/Fnr family transcriptional regulator n=1 Tax=Umezawaea sp. TaxID=1955258 RepID=UPI002ED20FD7
MSHGSAARGCAVLRAAGRSVPFGRGDRLIRAGETGDEVLLVEAGLVKVVLSCADGVESVVNVLGDDTLLGECAVLDEQPRSAHVLALLDGRAVHVAARTFLGLVAEDAAVRRLVDRTCADRRRNADACRLDQAHDVVTRAGSTMLRWARSVGTRTAAGLLVRGPSQRDIAQAVAASDQRVEEGLATMRGTGLVQTRRLGYLITRPDEFERWLAERRRGKDRP